MKILGIDFASLSGIPLRRRLQTLAIFYFSCEFFFLPLIYSFLFVALLFTRYWWLSVLYSVYFYHDRKSPVEGGKRKDWFKRLSLWRYMVEYFPLQVIKTADLDESENYIFGIHPHVITSSSTVLNFCFLGSGLFKHFPNLRVNMATLDGQFIFPIHRDLLLALGICSSSKEGINNVLRRKESLALVIGGAPEALSTRPDLIRLFLKNCKGFCKLAIKNGASLVQTFQFGENEIWHQTEFSADSMVGKLQRLITYYLSFSPPIFHVGKPIYVEKIENPTNEQVESLHAKYVESLMNLFDEYNPVYGQKDASIEIY